MPSGAGCNPLVTLLLCMPSGAVWGIVSTPIISRLCRAWEAATEGIFYFVFMAQQQTIFNYSHAAVIGVEEYVLALFLKDNFGIDAHCQKPLSVAKMAAEINFFTAKQLKRIIKSLEDGGWITAEKINAKLYDQSKAYKFTEKFHQLTTPF